MLVQLGASYARLMSQSRDVSHQARERNGQQQAETLESELRVYVPLSSYTKMRAERAMMHVVRVRHRM